MASKYLYKYVTKGPDRAIVLTNVHGADAPQARNEIRDYEDMRSIGSSEACHKLFAFSIVENKPPVQVLCLHLKDHQHVVFVGGQEENVAEQGRETELTAFFKYNAEEKERKGADFDPTDNPTYVDMANSYVLKKKQWKVREKGFSIGRVHTVNPLAGDVFYLRMLLHHNHCRGKTSFEDLLEVDGEPFKTYQAVCRHLGLLSDDQEWSTVLADAGGTQLCPQIRALYVIILL